MNIFGLRLLVVLTCYGLSGFGLMAAALGLPLVFSSAGSLRSTIVLLVWLSAIGALFRMSWAWIQNVRLGAKYSRRALFFGLASILVIPVLTLPEFSTDDLRKASIDLLLILAMEVLFVLPSILLAAYLNRFHGQQEPGTLS